MAYIREKEKAITLRMSGASINQIALKLQMNKSTVSVWCRDIALSAIQIRALDKRQRERGLIGSLNAAETKRATRLRNSEHDRSWGAHDVGHITDRDLFMLGIGLYWGEGYKSSNGEFGFTNSNPRIIKTFLLWVKDKYGIKTPDLILRVSINMHYRKQADAAVKHWAKITNVPLSQFTKTSFIRTPLRKQYSNNANYFGTLRVKVRRATVLQRRVLGSLDHVAEMIEKRSQ